MVTIKDMAEMLGISTTTVSNVIHGKTNQVSQKTIEKVQKLLEECDYVPNINASNLARNKSKIIGIAIKGNRYKYQNMLVDPFFSEIIGAMEAQIRKRGYFMMLYISDNIEEIIQYIATWNADGFIMIGMQRDDYIKVNNRYKKPAVMIDSYLAKDVVKYFNVGLDDENGGYQMAKYLIENGHRKIAFVADNMEGVDYYRFLGYKKAIEEYGMIVEEKSIIIMPPGKIEQKPILDELYDRAAVHTAFMFCSDYFAVMALNYFQDRGMKVPDDISITGFDNNRLSKIVRPMLTTVDQNISEKGECAVNYLIQLIDGKEPAIRDIKLPVELMLRGSVKRIKR